LQIKDSDSRQAIGSCALWAVRTFFCAACIFASISLVSCGGSNPHPTPAPPDFSLAVTPASLTIVAESAGQQVSVNAVSTNGFTSAVTVAITGLPNGVTANPPTLNLTPGTSQNLTLFAASTAAAGNATITFTLPRWHLQSP